MNTIISPIYTRPLVRIRNQFKLVHYVQAIVNWIRILIHILMWIESVWIMYLAIGYEYLNPDSVLFVNTLLICISLKCVKGTIEIH